MVMIRALGRTLAPRLSSRKGTTYVEYFIVALAMALAALGFASSSTPGGKNRLELIAEKTFGVEVTRQMNELKGPL